MASHSSPTTWHMRPREENIIFWISRVYNGVRGELSGLSNSEGKDFDASFTKQYSAVIQKLNFANPTFRIDTLLDAEPLEAAKLAEDPALLVIAHIRSRSREVYMTDALRMMADWTSTFSYTDIADTWSFLPFPNLTKANLLTYRLPEHRRQDWIRQTKILCEALCEPQGSAKPSEVNDFCEIERECEKESVKWFKEKLYELDRMY